MLNERDVARLEELISRMGKVKEKSVRLDAPGIGSADFVEEEEIAVVSPNGVVETRTIAHARLLDCSHLGLVSRLVAACDVCGRLCCDKCLQQCQKCVFLTCRYCRNRSNGREGSERRLCDSCQAKDNRRRAASAVSRAIADCFVSREEV